jgi:hypothetical protein
VPWDEVDDVAGCERVVEACVLVPPAVAVEPALRWEDGLEPPLVAIAATTAARMSSGITAAAARRRRLWRAGTAAFSGVL